MIRRQLYLALDYKHAGVVTCVADSPSELAKRCGVDISFTLDACATPENAKCERYFTPEMDGLKQDWDGVVWCNPPYGRGVGAWVEKAHRTAEESDATVVMLLPARTDTAWFHDYCYNDKYATINFVRGRLKFGGEKNSAPFPSMVVIFRRPAKALHY